MKQGRVFWRVLVFLAALSLLPGSGSRAEPEPTPTPHKKKHRVANPGDDDSATPSLSPESGRSRHHRTHHTGAGEDGDQDAPTSSTAAGGSSGHPAPLPAATSSIDASELSDFDGQPEPVRRLLQSALDLTRRNLTYTYGSSDPVNGGMDCSGTIAYLLKSGGFEEVPRSASEQYVWVRQRTRFYAVLSKKEDTFELNEMRPGDLLFWTGTYNVDRDPPVTHTMLYLGRRKKDGKRLMMGASDGRPYDGEKRNGVSVFDFRMPAAKSADSADAKTAAAPDHSPDFAGYGPIPGMAERNDAANRQAAALRADGKEAGSTHP
jgi:cell wall-associated NlpC family hydrolase